MDSTSVNQKTTSRSAPNPMSPSELLMMINQLLNRWAAEDAKSLQAETAQGNMAEGHRTGNGAASVVPYVLSAIQDCR